MLVYESGTIGSKPHALPLSIGDGELAETADAVVPVPEIFNYWLQGGRIDVGFLGAAQIDRHGNLNSTVIGDYDKPKVRAARRRRRAGDRRDGGRGDRDHAPVRALRSSSSCTSARRWATATGRGDRERLGLSGGGPTVVITDLGVLRPDPESRELTLTQVHAGVSADDARAKTGWDLRVADDLGETEPPSDEELTVLRELQATLAKEEQAA